MKYILIFLGVILVIISVFLLLIFSPYFIYLKTINQGFSSSFLSMEASKTVMIKPIEFKIKKINKFLAQNERRWRSFHFADYKIPLPLQHPTLSLIPVIQKKKGRSYFGGDIYDNKNSRKFSFVSGEKLALEYVIDKQELFGLPIFKQDLEAIPGDKFFKIMFTYDIRLKKIDKKNKISYMRSLWNIPYADLVFNLFVLNARNDFFPEDMIGFTFYPEKEMGIIETSDENPNFYNETVYILEGEDIYTFKYRVRKGDLLADSIRTRFLKILNFKKSYEDKRIEIYNDFRLLSYKDKISTVGFTYLYVGFSHVPNDQIYYSAMIRDLEKRAGNAKFLTPLYQYGMKKFNFKENKKKKKEVAKPKEFNEEDKQIIKEAIKQVEETEVDESRLSKEEKINFYLEDAKTGEGLESEEGVMEMD